MHRIRLFASARLLALAGLLGASLLFVGFAGAQDDRDGEPSWWRDESTILVKFTAPADAGEIVAEEGDDEAGETTGRVRIVKLRRGKTVEEALARYRARGNVAFAEPNYIATAQLAAPNDTSYGSQWGLAKIKAADAWSIYPGSYVASGGSTVAVVDTGVDLGHADLAAHLLPGSAANCLTGTCSGAVSAADDNGHGTHVAGIAAAVTNNGTGVAGVSINSSIMAVKALNSSGSGSYAAISSGIKWAVDHGADVINLSLGGYSYSSTLCGAVSYAVSNGVVLVAAAGNDGSSQPLYPASCPGAIGVAATNSSDGTASWSNYGSPNVFVSAPGVSIYSTYLGGGYATMSGTSMATPFVAGLAGLLVAQVPSRTATDVRVILASTSDKPAGVTFGSDPLGTCACTWNASYGYGRINASQALSSGGTPPPPPPPPPATPDFSLAASPTSSTTTPGGSVAYTIGVGALNGFGGQVSLAVSGLPTGTSASFGPNPAAAGSSSTLTVQTTSSTPAGSYPLTITGTSGSLQHTTAATLVVSAPQDFTLGVSPSSRSIRRGNNTSYTVSIGGVAGFSGPVSLVVSGLPPGASASFNRNPVSPGGTSRLSISTSRSTPRTTYTLTITGTSGSLAHSASVTLTVR
jgi:thermitase